MDKTKLYKLKNPEVGEEHLLFRITNHNEVTNRCYICPINSELSIPGQELVSYDEIEVFMPTI